MDLPFCHDLNSVGRDPYDAESKKYDIDDVFTPLGDIYMRYAEVFQKEVEAGRKSEIYTAMAKKAQSDAELKQMLKNHIIESYKTAIFDYWLTSYFMKYHMMEQNSRKIAEIRKRIRELEGLPNPQKDNPSPLK